METKLDKWWLMVLLQTAEKLLHTYFGYNAFRASQKPVIKSVLEGRSTFAIMPTGGGKSICYQIPGLMMDGMCLVISPLISLMKDQVDRLRQVGISATYMNSSLSMEEVDQRILEVKRGDYKYLYIAPERLESSYFQAYLHSLPIDLIAIDEAHCISTWGHDFRPSYRLIPEMIQRFRKPPIVMALTATATEEVQQDITQLLSIHRDQIYHSGFARENLIFSVRKEGKKKEFIRDYVKQKSHQTGIIYTSTRNSVDELYQYLQQQGVATARYHAGLDEGERLKAQEDFSYDRVSVMVATNAFGMGIDKSNVRYVIHYHLPRTIESYYQEAGRAGRDGLESECILLFHPNDRQIHHYLIEHSDMDPERQQIEKEKLSKMEQYARTQQCLAQTIVHYFGDYSATACERCGNCYLIKHGVKQDYTIVAQKIFSCIKRMRERYGLSLVSKVLTGSKSKQVLDFGFHRLPTYGILQEYTQKVVSDLCGLLVTEGYIQIHISQAGFPIAKLTEQAVEVLLGKRKVSLYQERQLSYLQESDTPNSTLFESLRSLRKELSSAESVPPYVVCEDKTLKAMCLWLPQDRTAMLRIKGMGEKRFEKYGKAFLEAIQQFIEQNTEALDAREAAIGKQSEKV